MIIVQFIFLIKESFILIFDTIFNIFQFIVNNIINFLDFLYSNWSIFVIDFLKKQTYFSFFQVIPDYSKIYYAQKDGNREFATICASRRREVGDYLDNKVWIKNDSPFTEYSCIEPFSNFEFSSTLFNLNNKTNNLIIYYSFIFFTTYIPFLIPINNIKQKNFFYVPNYFLSTCLDLILNKICIIILGIFAFVFIFIICRDFLSIIFSNFDSFNTCLYRFKYNFNLFIYEDIFIKEMIYKKSYALKNQINIGIFNTNSGEYDFVSERSSPYKIHLSNKKLINNYIHIRKDYLDSTFFYKGFSYKNDGFIYYPKIDSTFLINKFNLTQMSTVDNYEKYTLKGTFFYKGKPDFTKYALLKYGKENDISLKSLSQILEFMKLPRNLPYLYLDYDNFFNLRYLNYNFFYFDGYVADRKIIADKLYDCIDTRIAAKTRLCFKNEDFYFGRDRIFNYFQENIKTMLLISNLSIPCPSLFKKNYFKYFGSNLGFYENQKLRYDQYNDFNYFGFRKYYTSVQNKDTLNLTVPCRKLSFGGDIFNLRTILSKKDVFFFKNYCNNWSYENYFQYEKKFGNPISIFYNKYSVNDVNFFQPLRNGLYFSNYNLSTIHYIMDKSFLKSFGTYFVPLNNKRFLNASKIFIENGVLEKDYFDKSWKKILKKKNFEKNPSFNYEFSYYTNLFFKNWWNTHNTLNLNITRSQDWNYIYTSDNRPLNVSINVFHSIFDIIGLKFLSTENLQKFSILNFVEKKNFLLFTKVKVFYDYTSIDEKFINGFFCKLKQNQNDVWPTSLFAINFEKLKNFISFLGFKKLMLLSYDKTDIIPEGFDKSVMEKVFFYIPNLEIYKYESIFIDSKSLFFWFILSVCLAYHISYQLYNIILDYFTKLMYFMSFKVILFFFLFNWVFFVIYF